MQKTTGNRGHKSDYCPRRDTRLNQRSVALQGKLGKAKGEDETVPQNYLCLWTWLPRCRYFQYVQLIFNLSSILCGFRSLLFFSLSLSLSLSLSISFSLSLSLSLSVCLSLSSSLSCAFLRIYVHTCAYVYICAYMFTAAHYNIYIHYYIYIYIVV